MRIILSIVLLAMLSSCSVVMASKKRGVGVDQISQCTDRACFSALRDTELLERSPWEGGERVVYKSLMPQGSTGRAVMHGLLDVVTIGIWEVAGTPIEGNKNDDEFLVYTVYYNAAGVAQKVEISAVS